MRRYSVGIIIISLLLPMPLTTYAQVTARAQWQGAEKISLDIKGMDILDVFRILSMKAGLNIVAGKNVTGRVTLFLKDVDVQDAFEIIIAANGLAYEKRGNIIYVMTARDYELDYGRKYQDRRIVKSVKLEHVKAADVSKAVSQLKTNIGRVVADETSDTLILMDIPEVIVEMEKVIKELDVPLITKVYSLQYAVADTLKDKLSEMLTKNVGSLRIDERTNKIAITDLEEKITLFDKVITAFDEKHKEVLIEAKILQITLDDEFSMGINWDAVFTRFVNKLHKITTIGVNLKYGDQANIIPTSTSTEDGGALQIGELSSEGYQAVIQALKEYGQTNLLSAPRIVALNNEEAKILVGTNQPYATRSISQSTGGTANVEAENVTFLDLGVKLYVTPTINEDNYITMKIKPEVSSKLAKDYEIKSSGNLIPVVKTTTTETTVMVKDGATILIGGLIEDRHEEQTKEVPWLADIPLFGNIFRSKTRGSTSNPEKTELVIFLTPHIITGEEPKDLLTVEKVAQDMAVKEAGVKGRLAYGHSAKEITVRDMSPQEYYDFISAAITKNLQSYRPLAPVYGEVVVSFVLDNKGRLLSTPKVCRGDSQALSQIGIRSICEAAPFPAFPESIDKKQESFQIAISYE